MLYKKYLLILTLSYFCITKNILPENSQLEIIQKKDKNKKTKLASNLYLDFDSLTKTTLLLDFHEKSIIIPNSEKFEWGINCQDSETCKKKSETETKDKYKENNFIYKEAEIVLRPFSEELEMDEKLEKVKIKLMESNESWLEEKWGVLGMCPKSDFINYLKNLFGEFSFIINVEPLNIIRAERDWKTEFYFNYVFNKKDILGEHDFLDEDLWKVKGFPVLEKKNENLFNEFGKVCFDFNNNFFVSFESADKFCEESIKKACNSDSCNKNKINFDKVKTFVFKIDDVEYNIYPSEFLTFQSDSASVKCEMIKSEPNEECSYYLGRRFFRFYKPNFYIEKGKNRIAFLNRVEFNIFSTTLIATFIIFFFILNIFLCVVIYKNVKQPSEKECLDLTMSEFLTEKTVN